MAVLSEDATTSHDITTDAGFRAWAQAIHDRLIAVGLTQTADTGQIDLATVTTPGSNSTDGGYEVYQFTDAAQGSDPIYLKITYGRATGVAVPRITIQAGTGSNGSGTLSNANTASTHNLVAPNGAGYIAASFADGALVLIVLGSSTVSTGAYIIIERVRDKDGTLIAGTFACLDWAASGTNNYSLRNGGSWGSSPAIIINNGTGAISGVAGVGYFRLAGGPYSPLRGMLMMLSGVGAAGDTGNVRIDGANKSYKRLATPAGASFGGVPNTTNFPLLRNA